MFQLLVLLFIIKLYARSNTFNFMIPKMSQYVEKCDHRKLISSLTDDDKPLEMYER